MFEQYILEGGIRFVSEVHEVLRIGIRVDLKVFSGTIDIEYAYL